MRYITLPMLTILSLAQATIMLHIQAFTETRFADLNLLLAKSTRKMQSSLTVLGDKLCEGIPIADDRGSVSRTREAGIDRLELKKYGDSIRDIV